MLIIQPLYCFDGNWFTNFAEARKRQWHTKEMYTLYFRTRDGKLLKVCQRFAGDY